MSNKALIVIVTHNGADYLGDCLSSLGKITYPANNFKIFVVDNASTDGSVEYIKNNFPEVLVHASKTNLGFAAGNNIGLQYAVDHDFEYVYLLNQDTVVEPDFLNPAVALAAGDSTIAAVQSKLLLYQDKTKVNSIGNEIHYLGFGYAGGHQTSDTVSMARPITYPSGAAVLLRVTALKQAGFFNEEFFMYHEDLDLGWRLWLAGYKVMLTPQSVVYHKYEFSRSIKKYYYMERNRYLVMLQNYRWLTLLVISPALLAMETAMLAYAVVRGFFWEKLKAYGYFLNIKSWQKLFKARQLVQSHRKLKDREVISKFVGRIDFQDIDNPLLKHVGNPIFNAYWQLIRVVVRW